MADLTMRGVSDELHRWLKQQADAHHRSVNKEAIVLLESIRQGVVDVKPRLSADEILDRARRFARLPVFDDRSAESLLGYDSDGLPR